MRFAVGSNSTSGTLVAPPPALSLLLNYPDVVLAYPDIDACGVYRQVGIVYLSIALLGPLSVLVNNEALSISRAKKIEALLVYLALEVDRAHTRTTLDGLLFPEMPEESARTNLRQTVARLRAAIHDADASPSFLLLTPDSIQFNASSDYDLDAVAFRSGLNGCHVHRGKRTDTCPDCMQQLQEAIALYRGPFCEGFFIRESEAFETWLQQTREQFHQQAIDALQSLADYYERRGEYAQATHYVRRQLELEPWREEAHRQLMRLLARQGQRSAALQQYERCKQSLQEELAVEPAQDTVALVERIRAAADVRPHNLPDAPTSFVGRERELALISAYLADWDKRLITLVGLGGIGKTRLALRAAQRVAHDYLGPYMDGVFFVALAGIHSTHSLINAIADALQMSFSGATEPLEQLNKFLRDKEVLLVLDNFEQLGADAIDVVSAILRQTHCVHLLITTRELLKSNEEWIVPIGGLRVPEHDVIDAQAWTEEYSALALFAERAQQIIVNFDLVEDADEAVAVAQICRLVEGLPLGIELAAAWVNVLSCRVIAQELQRIGNTLDMLATTKRDVIDRHRSIRAAFEHSWQRLDPVEQSMLAQLSVFQGAFMPEAAIHVAQIDEPVASLRVLSALVDKSLLRRGAGGRVDLHELVRQFAEEKLAADSAEEEATRERHAAYYGAILHQSEKYLEGDQELDILKQIRGEIQNVRAGWEWAAMRANERLIDQYVVSLYDLYSTANWYREGHETFDMALGNLVDVSRIAQSTLQNNITLAKLLSRQADFYYELGDPATAMRMLHQSLSISELQTNNEEVTFAYRLLGLIHYHQGTYAEAKQFLLQSLDFGRATGDSSAKANTCLVLGGVSFALGDYDEARSWQQRSLSIYEAEGKSWGVAHALRALGTTAQTLGDYVEAEAYFRRGLALFEEAEIVRGMIKCMNGIGLLWQQRAGYDQAKEWHQRSLALCYEHSLQFDLASTLSFLGDAALLSGDTLEAKGYLRGSLATATAIKATPVVLQTLVSVADLLIHETIEMTGQLWNGKRPLVDVLTKSYELLNIVVQHPASSRETRERARPLLNAVAARLSPNVVKALEENTETQELEIAIETVLSNAKQDTDILQEAIWVGDIFALINSIEGNPHTGKEI